MNKLLIGVVIALVSAGFFSGMAVASRMPAAAPEAAVTDAANPSPAADTQAPARAGSAAMGALPDLSPVAEKALEVAANITSTNVVRRSDPWSMFFLGEPSVERAQSLGSGVVVSADGLILTNTHVIGSRNAQVRVTLGKDAREREAEIVGIDELSDLSVLRVKATGLPTLPWGDSSKLRVAEWVLAVGNPFQLSGTVTVGVVSTVNRSQSGGVTDYIQTDAAINQGNSGGALVNGRGELVGINSMIYSPTGGNLGIGFAIPSNVARQILGELVRNGSVPWGSIGYVQWVEPAVLRRYYDVDVDGLFVNEMSRNSPAYRGGLRPQDIVTGFNGESVDSRDEIETLIAKARAGTEARVEIERQGRRMTLTIPIASRSEQQVTRPRAR